MKQYVFLMSSLNKSGSDCLVNMCEQTRKPAWSVSKTIISRNLAAMNQWVLEEFLAIVNQANDMYRISAAMKHIETTVYKMASKFSCTHCYWLSSMLNVWLSCIHWVCRVLRIFSRSPSTEWYVPRVQCLIIKSKWNNGKVIDWTILSYARANVWCVGRE